MEPQECNILSVKDIDIFTKKLQNLVVHLELTTMNARIPSRRGNSTNNIAHKETCAVETVNRLRATHDAQLALKYYRTL